MFLLFALCDVLWFGFVLVCVFSCACVCICVCQLLNHVFVCVCDSLRDVANCCVYCACVNVFGCVCV